MSQPSTAVIAPLGQNYVQDLNKNTYIENSKNVFYENVYVVFLLLLLLLLLLNINIK